MSRTILLDGAQWRVWMDELPPGEGRGAGARQPPRPQKCLRFARVSDAGDAEHDHDYTDPEPHDADVGAFDLSEEFLQSRLRELLRRHRH